MRLICWLLWALLGSAAPALAATADATYTLSTADGVRTYYEHAPANPSTTLVVLLHGLHHTASWINTVSGLKTAADTDGFILETPEGLSGAWNANGCCEAAVADDVGFIDAVIAGARSRHAVSKVYVVGYSNGGMLAYLYGCTHDVTGIAVVSGVNLHPCHPAYPVRLLDIHGLKDSTVPYRGGATALATFPPVANGIGAWHNGLGCSRTTEFKTRGYQTTNHYGCGAWMQNVRVLNGGHGWSDADYGVSTAVRKFVGA